MIGAMGAQAPEAQSARPNRIHMWSIKHSDKELHLEPNALVITKKTSIFLSGGLTDGTPPLETVFPDEIPISSILAIVEEVVTHKPAEEARNRTLKRLDPENMLAEIGEAGEGALGAPAYPIMLLAQAGALQVFHGVRTKLYSVRIVWMENGILRNTTLALSPKGADSFSQQLAAVIHKQTIIIRFDSETGDKDARNLVVRFREPTAIGNITVWGGIYDLLLLKGSTGEHLVYFFSKGAEMPEDALIAVPAESLPPSGHNQWKIELGSEPGGSRCVREIVTDQEQLRLPSCSNTIVQQ